MKINPLSSVRKAVIEEKKRKSLERLRLYKLNNKDKIKEQGKRYYLKYKERISERHKVYNQNGGNLRRLYNITLSDYQLLLKKQNGKCEICERHETIKLRGKVKNLAVDHDHKSGKVRGLLCSACNRAIGYFGEDIKVLESALIYLKRHGK